MVRRSLSLPLVAVFILSMPMSTLADELSADVAAMLRLAASRDAAALDNVAAIATATFPAQAAAIDALARDLRRQRADDEKARKRAVASDIFAGWAGDAEFGASLSTGNSDDKAVALRLDLVKETVKWRHEVEASADFQRADGDNSKQRYTAGYDANYFINPKLYAAGQFAWERDLFSGYRHRLTETLGFGYVVLDGDGRRLSVEGGPGARHSFQVREPGVEPSEHEFVFRAAVDFTQDLGDGAKFQQNVKSLIGAENRSTEATSSLTARINALFSARIAVTLRHESNPPDQRKSTDSLSRATLVYTF